MTTYNQIESLVRAHFNHDNEMFRRVTLQVAAHQKTEQARAVLRKLAEKNVTEILIPMNARSLVEPLRPVTFAQLVLSERVKATLAEITDEFGARDELAERQLPVRARLLFHGPTGCGKTATASAIADVLGLLGYEASLARLTDSYMGKTGESLANLFPALTAGALLVMNELDSLGQTRDSAADGAGRERNQIVNTLLTLMDSTPGGFLIATTNRVDMLDPAFRRRFDEEIEFEAPSPEAVATLIGALSVRYGLAAPPLCNGPGERTSFDAITKTVQREARRVVMEEMRGKVRVAGPGAAVGCCG